MKLPLFALLVTAAAAAPLLDRAEPAASASGLPTWPTNHEGRMLHPIPPAAEDAWLARQFPGKIGRFSDGERQIVLRWVPGATRQLHPAAQCFRGAGYQVEPAPMQQSKSGEAMTCFTARKGETLLRVCERLHDGDRRSWPDVSAWYWSALLSRSPRGYWSVLEVRSD